MNIFLSGSCDPEPPVKCDPGQTTCTKGGHEWCMDMKDKGKSIVPDPDPGM